MSTYKLVCPHCHGRMRIRTSEGQHIFLRITYMQCTNEACGWAVRAEFQMTHELEPQRHAQPAGVCQWLMCHSAPGNANRQ